MKSNGFTTVCLALALLFQVSCGKKEKSTSGNTSGSENLTETAPGLALFERLSQAVRDNNISTVRQLLRDERSRLNLNRKDDQDDDTLLCMALRYNHRKIAEMLIEEGASIELQTYAKNSFGWTPLMVAAGNGHLHLVKMLVEKDVVIDRKTDEVGRTALHLSITRKFDDVAIFLIQSGASLEATDKEGRNAYALSLINGSSQVIDYIHSLKQIKAGAMPDAETFRNLIIQGDTVYLSKVLAKYPDLAHQYESINPLALAIENKNENLAYSMVKMLILYQVDSNGPAKKFTTPLIRAVKTNRVFIAEYLIQKKANVDTQDAQGNSPLYYAVENNSPEMVDLLLAHQAESFFKKKYFNPCNKAWEVSRALVTTQDKIDNQSIRLKLGCR